jgi:hypothetical protein
MITKEVTKQATGEYGILYHVKTVYKIFGLAFYTIKTETLN